MNDYASRLLDGYDAWTTTWSRRIANAPERDLELVITQATAALDTMMQDTATDPEGLREAYLLGYYGATIPLEDLELEPIELTAAGQMAYEYYVDRNQGFVEWSFAPTVRDDLRLQPAAILASAAAIALRLSTYRARVTTYAGPYWALIWTGMGHAAQDMQDARTSIGVMEPVPILRVLDPNAQHCDTCLDKEGWYASWDEMISVCGGVPGDGSDACGCNCRCWLIVGESLLAAPAEAEATP